MRRPRLPPKTVRVRRIEQVMSLISCFGFERAIYQMTHEQYKAARSAIDAAVSAARGGQRPKSVLIDGRAFPLAYSNFGRVFVCNQKGERLLGSYYCEL